jgi:hypothetical protein
VAIFKDGTDLDGKGLPALVALVSANAGGFSFHRRDAFKAAAMWANRAIWPHFGFHKLICGGLVVKINL